MSSWCRLVGAVVVLLALAVPLRAQRPANEWTQWRGPNRDASTSAPSDPKAWPEKLTQKWKVEVGLGYATPIVVGNRVYQWARQGEREVMLALDADSGKVLWETGHTATFTMQSATVQHGPGPKSTPVYSNGRLYSIGMTGIVTAYDAASGKQLWQKPASPVPMFYTTHAFSPIIEQGMVIFHVGGHNDGALTAYDINTGAEKWSWKGDGPGYGSPVVLDVGGTRQIVTITQGKLVSVEAATGMLLWERPFVIANFTNSITPIVYNGNTVIVSGNGGPTTAIAVARRNNQWVTETLWENADIPLRMSDALIVGDTLFGMANRNAGQYFAVDAKSGKTLWTSEGRQAGHAAIARAGDLFFSLEDDGELVVLRNSPTAFEPLHRYKVAEAATWTPAAYSGNRIFVKDVSSLSLWTTN